MKIGIKNLHAMKDTNCKILVEIEKIMYRNDDYLRKILNVFSGDKSVNVSLENRDLCHKDKIREN